MSTQDAPSLHFIAKFRVLVESVSPVADSERMREMVEAVETVARDHGGVLVINDVRWTS